MPADDHEPEGAMLRPVAPQDAAGAVVGVVLLTVAVVLVPVSVEPATVGAVTFLSLVSAGIFLLLGRFTFARTRLAQLVAVPRVDGTVGSRRVAARRGAAAAAVVGVLLLVVFLVLATWLDSSTGGAGALGVGLGTMINQYLVARALQRWEGENGLVVCRRGPPSRFPRSLRADLERMVAVPVER